MFGLFGAKRPKPNLGTMTINPADPALKRPVRVFISHRWDDDPSFYQAVLNSLGSLNGLPVQNLSLTAEQRIAGARNGRVDDLEIKIEIAKRIRECDLFFAPADCAAADEHWLQYETERAVEYGRPVVFVSRQWRRARWNRYAKQLQALEHPTATTTTDPDEIRKAARSILARHLH